MDAARQVNERDYKGFFEVRLRKIAVCRKVSYEGD